jgi:hypothetical protein
MALKSAADIVSGLAPGSAPALSICACVARPFSALRSVLRRWAKAAATTPANAGLGRKAGAARTVSLATADHTFGGG